MSLIKSLAEVLKKYTQLEAQGLFIVFIRLIKSLAEILKKYIQLEAQGLFIVFIRFTWEIQLMKTCLRLHISVLK